MTVHADFDAVLLPDRMVRGLTLLIGRTIASNGADAAKIMRALFGDGTPAFGQVRRVDAKELRAAADLAAPGAAPITGLRELAELVAEIGPDTPTCPSCGELPLSNTGGKISALPAGAACPFCGRGTLAAVPVTLKKLAWTDGRLVEPQTSHDLRVRPGERIPLDDDGLRDWLGGWMHLGLEQCLKDSGVPLYGFLAYMRLVRRAFDRLEDAADLVQEPNRFGLDTDERRRAALREAKAMLTEREVTNAPRRPRLFFLRGIPEDAERVNVAGRDYVIEGRIGSGDKAEVYRGFWDGGAFAEEVVIKICRDMEGAALMAREVETLSALHASTENGADHFTTVVPEIVAVGDVDGRPATVFRRKNQYDWTLADVLREYPRGVDPETMVWMWNRITMLMAWVHRNGLVHGALVPAHVLIHPRNHGATFLDWAYAARAGEPLAAVCSAHAAFHPDEVRRSAPVTPETDIAMSARSMIAVLGGDPASGDLPSSVPQPLAEAVRLHARYGKDKKGAFRFSDALELHVAFGKIAEGVYGPRRYHPFHMPRRSR